MLANEENGEGDVGYGSIFNYTSSYAPLSLFSIIGGDTVFGRPRSCQTSFQDSGSVSFDGIIDLHNDIMLGLVFISVFILYLLFIIA